MTQLKETYKNNASIAAGFAALCIVFGASWLYYSSLVTIILGLLEPKLATYFAKTWKLVTRKLGKVNAFTILSVFYALVITPVSLLFKLLNRRSKILNTSWIKNSGHKHIDFTKPY